MSDLESRIKDLERELALKKGYQSLKVVLPKTLPKDVAEEIEAKIQEVSNNLAMSKEAFVSFISTHHVSTFTEEETNALKLIAASVLKKTVNPGPPQTSVPNEIITPTKSNDHVAVNHGAPRKAKILLAENIRGEGKKYAAPDDEIYVPNPEKIDDHGMVSATHLKRGGMLKIPLDDLEWIN